MDIVVYLALVVLGAVFLFSLFILIIICRRKHEYNRILFSQSLRFSKLRQENMEDIEQLGPHISRALDRNHWLEEMTTGLLQHCVAVLKLCHLLTDKMAKIPLIQQKQQHRPAEMNEFICKATARIVPRLGLELFPVLADQLIKIVQEMDFHMTTLQMALNKATELEEEQQQELISKTESTFASTSQLQNTQQIGQNSQEDQQQGNEMTRLLHLCSPMKRLQIQPSHSSSKRNSYSKENLIIHCCKFYRRI
uniref:Transmembrane protein 98 n=1 Tax=Globodera rostochiensis TaxID=31243 RepID=A0A914GQF6_GLORO